MSEREAIIWCPKCREDKGELLRIATQQQGVYQHRTNPNTLAKTCACGTNLERKP